MGRLPSVVKQVHIQKIKAKNAKKKEAEKEIAKKQYPSACARKNE